MHFTTLSGPLQSTLATLVQLGVLVGVLVLVCVCIGCAIATHEEA